MTQWKVANSLLFAILQVPISLDKGFCTEGDLNKQYQKYIQSQRFYINNLKVCHSERKSERNEYFLQKRTFSWLSLTPSGASVVPDYIICMEERYIRVKE